MFVYFIYTWASRISVLTLSKIEKKYSEFYELSMQNYSIVEKCRHHHYCITCVNARIRGGATWTARITQPFSLSLVSFSVT
jgi:hypothetical protein